MSDRQIPFDIDKHTGVPFTLENQLCFAIYSLSNTIARFYRDLLGPDGLTFPQYLTMLALWEYAPCPVNTIGRALNLESNTLTPLLKRLEALGYLARVRDVRDERRVEISLTAKGKAFRDEAMTVRAELVCRLGMSEESIAELRMSLTHLAQVIRD